MKKKFMITAAIAALTLVGGYLGKAATDRTYGLSDLQLENAEALAYGEFIVGKGWECFQNVYDDVTNPMFFIVIDCKNCYTTSAVYLNTNDYCWH